jgi:hypothetical protein
VEVVVLGEIFRLNNLEIVFKNRVKKERMKYLKGVLILVVCSIATFGEENKVVRTPFQLVIDDEVRLFKEPQVYGLEVDIFGNTKDIDTEDSKYIIRSKDLYGVNLSMLGEYKKNLYGIQLGVYVMAQNIYGIQVGGLASAENVFGLQVGGFTQRINLTTSTQSVKNVYGIQIGNNVDTKRVIGVQIGTDVILPWFLRGYNFVGKTFYLALDFMATSCRNDRENYGIQINTIQVTEKSYGINISGISYSKIQKGIQLGVVNIGKEVRGLQLGIINYATNLKGVQIGALNIINNYKITPVMIGINMSW